MFKLRLFNVAECCIFAGVVRDMYDKGTRKCIPLSTGLEPCL